MIKLFYFSILLLFTAFTCESDDAVADTEADSLLFPDVACGSMAVEIDGVLISYDDVFAIISDPAVCRLKLTAVNAGPGFEDRIINLVISPPNLGTYILEETGATDEYCELTRVTWQYRSAASADEEILPQFAYSSRASFGGEGYLEITELELNFEDDLQDYISGQFEFTAGVFFDETGAAPDTITIRGSFCEIPIENRICDPTGEVIC